MLDIYHDQMIVTPTVMVNIDDRFDSSNLLGNHALGMPESCYLDRLIEGGWLAFNVGGTVPGPSGLDCTKRRKAKHQRP